DKETKADSQLLLEHGKPMLYGKERKKGIRLAPGSFSPEAVVIGENGITEADILVHDEHEPSGALAFLLSRLAPPVFPTALGILRAISRPSYESLAVAQEEAIIAKK